MKKIAYILAGGLFILASCSSGENKVQELQDHVIDSTVSAKLAQRAAENVAKNDSILKRMENEQADTMEKEQKGAQKKPAPTKTNTAIKSDTTLNK